LTVDELVKGVNIALGNSALSECPEFDSSEDGRVTIDELIKGVNAALQGCVSGVTATPGTPEVTRTPTRTLGAGSPSPTLPAGQASVARRAAATVEVTGSAMLSFSNVFAVLIRQAGGLFGSGSGGVAIPVPCPQGGQINVDCTQDIIPGIPPRFGPPEYTLGASDCSVTGSAGNTVNLNGTIGLVGKEEGDLCFVSVPSATTLTIPSLTIVVEGTGGTVTATFTGVSGALTLSGSDPDCRYNTAAALLTGSLQLETKGPDGTTLNTTSMSFDDTTVTMVVEQFDDGCGPVIYRTVINGAIEFTTGEDSFTGTYTDYTLRNDGSSGTSMLTVSGAVDSACFGTPVQFSTHTPITAGQGGGCPLGGEVDAAHDGTTDRIRFTSEGGVEIDQGNNGTVDDTFNSCLNPQLFKCPAT